MSLEPLDAADPDDVYMAFVEWAESTGISLYPAADASRCRVRRGAVYSERVEKYQSTVL